MFYCTLVNLPSARFYTAQCIDRRYGNVYSYFPRQCKIKKSMVSPVFMAITTCNMRKQNVTLIVQLFQEWLAVPVRLSERSVNQNFQYILFFFFFLFVFFLLLLLLLNQEVHWCIQQNMSTRKMQLGPVESGGYFFSCSKNHNVWWSFERKCYFLWPVK